MLFSTPSCLNTPWKARLRTCGLILSLLYYNFRRDLCPRRHHLPALTSHGSMPGSEELQKERSVALQKPRERGWRKTSKGNQRLKKECRSECKQVFNNYLANIISPESKTNPKRFWSFIKGRRCDHSGVAPLKSKEGIMFSDSQTKASILNSQFSSVSNMAESLDSMKDLTLKRLGGGGGLFFKHQICDARGPF